MPNVESWLYIIDKVDLDDPKKDLKTRESNGIFELSQ